MKGEDSLKKVLQYIVGFPTGFLKEGNEQWYYFLALVMSCMLTWWLKPQLGIVFTICAAMHFAVTIIYGLKELLDLTPHKKVMLYSILYFAISLAIFIICMIFSWSWTLITSAIAVVAFLIATDDMGSNFFMHPLIYTEDYNEVAILICHTVWFALFATITLLLPISIWIRLAIIIACIILHPLIDILEGECINVVETTVDSFYNIVDSFEKQKRSTTNEEKH